MRWRIASGDLSGVVADLGVLVPMVAALVLVNGLHPAPVLVAAGVLVVASGVGFGIPWPVQPLKALTALAVAQGLSPETIHSAGLQIGLILLVLGGTGLADRLARIFTTPVIRSLQFAVGVLLVATSIRLVVTPPAIFAAAPPPAWGVALAAATVVVVALAVWRRSYLAVGVLLGIGLVVGVVGSDAAFGPVVLAAPSVSWPPVSVAASAFFVLVVPQLPLTYGNAVVGVSHLARETFGARARRVTPGRVAVSCGLGNVMAAAIGGMPMCHGSSGFTAHVRLGARTAAMNVVLGSTLLVLGVAFSGQVLTLFSVFPVWALAGFLAYAGARHAWLVADLRGYPLLLAIGAGALGVATGNLAATTAVALVATHGARLVRRRSRSTS